MPIRVSIYPLVNNFFMKNQYPGTLKLWNFGTLEPWNSETLKLWNFGTLEPWNQRSINIPPTGKASSGLNPFRRLSGFSLMP